MKIGAKLYTVRNQCKTLDDLDETLGKIADIGYRHVQLSGICAYEPDWMKRVLRKYGLKAEITHYPYAKIVGDTDGTIAFHNKLKCKYIGLGSIPEFKKNGSRPEDLRKFLTEIKPVAEKIAASGHKFMYHNHNVELSHYEGKTYLDMICEALPADICGITLDTYWVQAGGGDPAAYIRKLKGRLDCVHFKDMVYSGEDKAVRMAAIGDGNMNYPEILRACRGAGVKFAYVEQDNCYDEDPFECLRRSYEYLKSFGLE